MKVITQADLLTTLNAIRGATFATIISETDPKLKKTGNTLGPVRKVSRVNVCLGFQYENAVNRQRDREDLESDFEAKPRQWGVKISPMLVEHKGRIYLETKVEKSLDCHFIDAEGNKIPFEIVKPFLPTRSQNSRQATEKEVIVRDYALDSILTIAFKGEKYVLAQKVETVAVTIPRTVPVNN